MRALLAACAVLAALAPAAQASVSCKAVRGEVGYHAVKITKSGGTPCPTARRVLRRWVNHPQAAGWVKGPRSWSCTRRKRGKTIVYNCDSGPGRVRFTLKFSL